MNQPVLAILKFQIPIKLVVKDIKVINRWNHYCCFVFAQRLKYQVKETLIFPNNPFVSSADHIQSSPIIIRIRANVKICERLIPNQSVAETQHSFVLDPVATKIQRSQGGIDLQCACKGRSTDIGDPTARQVD